MRPLAISNISIFNIFHKILFNPIRRLIMKLVIILHGISGSGKSTTAKKFIEKYSKDNSNLSTLFIQRMICLLRMGLINLIRQSYQNIMN